MKWRGGYLVYGLPALALAVPTLPAHVLLPSFYAGPLGVGLAATGLAIFLARLIDVLSDPIIGHVSDQAGRRKPFIAVGAIFAAVALVALFAPPEGAGAIYLGIWCTLLYISWSVVMVPYTAWGAELSSDYRGRSQIASWREGMGLVGITLAATLPAALQNSGYSLADSMLATAILAIALGAPALLLLLLWVPEAGRKAHHAQGSFLNAFRAAAGNAPFRRLLGAWFINGVANGLPASLFPLFIVARLGASEQELGIVLLIYFAAALISLPVWLWLLKRVDKHRLWCLTMLAAIASFIWVPLLPFGSVVAFAGICIVTGFALGADLSLPPAMQADVVDWDRVQHGTELAGLFFAFSSMSGKLSAALAIGVAFPLLQLLGFDPKFAESAGDAAAPGSFAVAVIYAWVPCVFKAIAVAMMWRFPIDRQLHAELSARLHPNV
ncbi:MFS transporter [Dongia mobilis]|uniref:MFS transporter n=1 Tax=Dongia sp. TaxID=1977262 RepID=UPI0026F1DA6B